MADLTAKQKEEVVALAEKMLKAAGKQNPIILMNAALMVIKAAEVTYLP
jgi:hypothetical protein